MAIDLIHDEGRLVADLNSQVGANVRELTEGDTNVAFNVWGRSGWSTGTIKLGVVIPDDGAGSNRPIAGVFHLTNEENAEQDSGTLIVGKWYMIASAIGGSDSFLNVGASSNAQGVIFQATGTTPSVWASSTSLVTTTPPLDHDISATDLETALNASRLGSDHDMQFVVSGSSGGPWFITCSKPENFELKAVVSSLFPGSVATFNPSGALGSSTVKPSFALSLSQTSLAETSSFSSITAGSASANDAISGVLNTTPAVWDIGITGMPYAGTLSIDVENDGGTQNEATQVPFNVTAEALQSALESLSTVGSGNVSVEAIQSGPITYAWQLVFDASLGQVELTVNDTAIIFGEGKSCELDLDGTNLKAAISGRDQRTVRMELETTNSGTITTRFLAPVTILNDSL